MKEHEDDLTILPQRKDVSSPKSAKDLLIEAQHNLNQDNDVVIDSIQSITARQFFI
jgi:hypothetical protein